MYFSSRQAGNSNRQQRQPHPEYKSDKCEVSGRYFIVGSQMADCRHILTGLNGITTWQLTFLYWKEPVGRIFKSSKNVPRFWLLSFFAGASFSSFFFRCLQILKGLNNFHNFQQLYETNVISRFLFGMHGSEASISSEANKW